MKIVFGSAFYQFKGAKCMYNFNTGYNEFHISDYINGLIELFMKLRKIAGYETWQREPALQLQSPEVEFKISLEKIYIYIWNKQINK